MPCRHQFWIWPWLDLGTLAVEAEEGARGDVEEELRPVGDQGGAEAVEHLHRDAVGIAF